MTRQNRILLTMAVIALAGVAALALLAQQLRSRTTVRSVGDPRMHAEGATPPGAGAGSTEAPDPGDPGRASRLVDGFLAVRKAEAAVLAKHPIKAKQIEAALTGNYDLVKGQRMGQDLDVLQDFRMARDEALQKSSLTKDDYFAARAAYRSWASGKPVDPPLGPALEARRSDLGTAGLGGLELLDDQIK